MNELNEQMKNKIRKHCLSLSKHLKEPRTLRQELADELASNMEHEVLDLIKSGKTSDEAVTVVLRKFDSPHSFLSAFQGEYRMRKVASPWLLYSSLLFIILGSLIIGFFYYWNTFVLDYEAKLYTDRKTDASYNEKALQLIVEEQKSILAVWAKVRNSQDAPSAAYTYVYPEYLDGNTMAYTRSNNFFYRTSFQGVSMQFHNEILELDYAQIRLNGSVFYLGLMLVIFSIIQLIGWGWRQLIFKYRMGKREAIP